MLPRGTYTRQKCLVVCYLVILFVVPAASAVSWALFDWPHPLEPDVITRERYDDRMDLLKFIISLGLSIIGASWFLATRDTDRFSSNDPDYKWLSWSWTFIGTAVLMSFLEIFLTYKNFHFKPVEGSVSTLTMMYRHGYRHALQMTFRLTAGTFVLGGIVLVFAVLGLLHNREHRHGARDEIADHSSTGRST